MPPPAKAEANGAVASDAMRLSSKAKLAIWSEFVPYKKVMETLPDLKEKGLGVCVSITPKTLNHPDLLPLLAKAKELGVEVKPWLELGAEDDVWANKWNVEQTVRFAKEVTSYLTDRGFKPGEISIDMEPPKTLTDKVGDHLAARDLLGARKVLLESARSGSYAEAKQQYAKLVDELHADDIKIHVVTTPMVLDDMKVGGGRLQAALGVPIEGIDWDEVSFMTYRPEFENMVGAMGSSIIYSYGKDAVKYFGEKAGLDLGEVAKRSSDAPYMFTEPKDLQNDLSAAEQAGIKQAQIFSLDGMAGLGGLDRWFEKTSTDPIKFEPKAFAVRLMTQAIARSLPRAATGEPSRTFLDKLKGLFGR